MKDNPVAKNAHKFNKRAAGPHKDKKKASKKGDRKHKGKFDEKLDANSDAGDYVKDFRKSDAPQFKGKSDKKKQQMAIAAYLDSKDDDVNTQKEFFGRLAAVGLGAFLQKKKEQKVDHKKPKANLGLWDHKEKPMADNMDEWACTRSEKTRRVKGGDKRKKYMKEKQIEEGEKKGLWDRIHAKRKRGEKPAKPGDKDYPKTLDVGEGLKQARKNVGSDSCWDGYKATGTKMKNGKEVPDCKKEDAQQVDEISKTIKKAGQAAKTAAVNSVVRPSAQAAIHTGVAQAKDTAKTVSTGAKKVASGAKKVGGAVKKATGAIKKKSGTPNPVPKPKKANESMDPRDFTDKAGYIVTITRKGGKEEIKNFFNTKPAAQKYADRVKNTNKVGHVATIYKTDGRKLMKESTAGIEMTSVSTMLDELTKRDMERMAKRKQTNLVKRGKAKPEPKKPQQKDKSAGRTASKEGEDDHIVMQLRKAQDVKGNMDIKISPTGKTVKLPIKMIDKLLATHDKLQKPDDKRKFRIMVTKELRKRAK